eukprot:363303-Chlamydomonas_euryale.AAC.2
MCFPSRHKCPCASSLATNGALPSICLARLRASMVEGARFQTYGGRSPVSKRAPNNSFLLRQFFNCLALWHNGHHFGLNKAASNTSPPARGYVSLLYAARLAWRPAHRRLQVYVLPAIPAARVCRSRVLVLAVAHQAEWKKSRVPGLRRTSRTAYLVHNYPAARSSPCRRQPPVCGSEY